MVQTKKCRIDGMTCTNCEMRIGKTLRAMKGVIKANVSFKTASAEITFEDKKTTWGKILAAIEGLGYSVESAEGISPKRIWKNVLRKRGGAPLRFCLNFEVPAFPPLNPFSDTAASQ